MLISAIGLGIEGKKAIVSLQEYDFEIYATDLNDNLSPNDFGFSNYDEAISNGIDFDFGSHNFDKIDNSDAIIISPSLWNIDLANNYKNSGKMLGDVFNKHKSIFTIAVTGTNGKTTTVSMIKDILDSAGLNVLVGGNAGGGFNGYNDIILKAEFNLNDKPYDVILIEVCDMTLSYCKDTFDFDLIALTNIGNDHIDVHGSIENYEDSLINFFKDSNVILSSWEFNSSMNISKKFNKSANNIICADSYDNINLFGKFNYINAGIAKKVAESLNYTDSSINKIDTGIINNSLKNFNPVEGRLKVINYKNANVFIGKTDNSSAISAILNEKYFPIVFIGTPRFGEECRYDILDTIVAESPETIVLFPGLDNTVNEAKKRLENLNFSGNIEIANNINDVVDKLNSYLSSISSNHSSNHISNHISNSNNLPNHSPVFIGGNGQEKIIEIQNILENNSIL
ncbi:MAG: Mur ligase family protein [Methanobacteriaceae archaeon]